MWSLRGDRRTERASRFLGGPFGGFLYKRLNFSPRVLLPAVVGDRGKLTREAHRHYLAPFPRPADREAPWILARELIGSSDWYDRLWRMRDRIADTPALLLWGMRDPTFGAEVLERWEALFRHATTVRLPAAGHLPQEEEPETVRQAIRGFLARLPAAGDHAPPL